MKKIIVFGTGNYYKLKKESLLEKHEVIGFIDNTIKMGSVSFFEDLPVMNPKDGVKKWGQPIVLMSANFFDMFIQLRDLGVANRIIVGTCYSPAYDLFEGFLYKSGCTIYPDGRTLVINNNGNIYKAYEKEEWNRNIRILYTHFYPEIDLINRLSETPISRRYGREHGVPIDRYYIEGFLEQYRKDICGVVGEFGDDTYTKRFGNNVLNSIVFHVNGWGDKVQKANLETFEGINEEMVDCLICTQTIQFIFNVQSAITNIYRMLKKHGTALVTAHGIAQISQYDYRNWGEYWRFTEQSLKKLVNEHCPDAEVKIHSYGNAKVCAAMMYGLSLEDINEYDLKYTDEQFPLLLGLRIKRME